MEPLFSVTEVGKDGKIVVGFDSSRPLKPWEQKILKEAIARLPRYLEAALSLADDREKNLEILNSVKKELGGTWT